MSTMDFIWSGTEVCAVILYIAAAVFCIGYLWWSCRDCFLCTYWQAWLRSGLLAFLVTPSLVGDFWLFAVPGPAALGFALLSPGIVFATGHRLELLLMDCVLYVLPWIACTTIIFYLWRFIRWRRVKR